MGSRLVPDRPHGSADFNKSTELQLVQLLTKCAVCAGSRLHYMFSVRSSRIVRCDDCHLLLINPQPSPIELRRLREAQGEARDSELQEPGADAYLELVERYHGGSHGRLLQIGCGPQELLAAAAARGFNVSFMKKLGHTTIGESAVTVGGGDLSDLARDGLYDILMIFNELGQARDPRSFLKQVHRLLRPNGVLFIVTPALQPTLRRSNTTKFRSDHLFYFRTSALQSLLVDCGFGKIIAVPSKNVPPGNIVHMARKETLRDQKVLSVVVPVFNEVRTFSTAFDKLLAKQIEGLDIEIVVVESNSTDGTRREVLRYRDHPRVKVVLEDAPRGKGCAVRTGFQHITGDFVIIQDADLEYDLEDYEALLEPLRRGRAAFVLGARHGGSAWKMRQFNDQPVVAAMLNCAHWFFTALINVGFGARLKDPFTMYKVFRRDCLYGLTFECNRFDFDWEIVIKFLRKGYKPLEIPVNYRSRSFTEGKKISIVRDPLTWLRVLIKLRLSKLDPLAEIERQREKQAALTLAGSDPGRVAAR
jgi:hypothetical protein